MSFIPSKRLIVALWIVLAGLTSSAIAAAQNVSFFGTFQSYPQTAVLYGQGIVADAAGNLYISGIANLAFVPLTANGTPGTPYPLIDNNGSAAYGLAIDSANNLYRPDISTAKVAKYAYVSTNTFTKTFIGSGWVHPSSVAVDASFNVYVLDAGTGSIVKLTPNGSTYTQTTIYTNLSQLKGTTGLSMDSSGNFYLTSGPTTGTTGNSFASNSTAAVYKLTPSNGSYTLTSLGSGWLSPASTAVDFEGNIWVTDYNAGTINLLAPSNGSYTQSVYTSIPGIRALTTNKVGQVYGLTAGGGSNAVIWTGGSAPHTVADPTPGTSATVPVTVSFPPGTDLTSYSVVTNGSTGQEFTDAGTGVCPSGTYSVGDTCSINVSFTPQSPGLSTGAVVLYGADNAVLGTDYFYGVGQGPMLAFDPAVISTSVGTGNACSGSFSTCGDTGAATAATLNNPNAVVFDAAGDLYIADTADYVVRKVTPAGTITTVAGTGGAYCAFAPAACGDGGAATSATLDKPTGIALDGAGNLYIVDSGANKIREVAAGTGIITTIAGNGTACSSPASACGDTGAASSATFNMEGHGGAVVDPNANLVVADYGDNRIRSINLNTGVITTVAGTGVACGSPTSSCGDGGQATSAQFYGPTGVGIDSSGDYFIADGNDNRIRELSALTGVLSTVAGSGTDCATTPCGDGGAATSAQLTFPVMATTDPAGNIYIADSKDNAIRVVSSATGKISAVAGNYNGCTPFTAACGDGGGAPSAQLASPSGLALNSSGNIYIADATNRIREVNITQAVPLVFPQTNPGSTSAAMSVSVTNIGNAALTFSGNPSFPSGFEQDASTTCSTSLLENATCTLAIDFAPPTLDTYSGNLVLTDNDLNATTTPGTEQTVALSGTAVAPVPTVTGISPNIGGADGGTAISITGTGFTGATGVSFGGAAAFTFTVISDTSMIAVSPAGSGTVDVTVTTPGGTSPTSAADQFTYQQAQTIVFPPSGLGAAGTSTTLSATGGASGNPVTFSVVSGPATVSGTNGSTLTFTGSGTVIVEADQAGAPGYAAADPAQSIITVAPAPATYTAPATAIGSISETQTVYVNFTTAGTLGPISVLTQGATGLDFNIVAGGTCATGTAYTVGEVCTVEYSFTPKYPGQRLGAVQLVDSTGTMVLGTTLLTGTGTGPEVVFPGNLNTNTLGGGFNYPTGVAVDGAGDVFVADNSNDAVKEIVAVGGSISADPEIRTLGSDFSEPYGVAVDGAGDVYVADFSNNAVKEIMAVGGSISADPEIRVLGSDFSEPDGVAVDGAGNVYVADAGNKAVKEIVAVGGSIPANNPVINTLGSGFISITGLAVDGAGDVYVADAGNRAVEEIVAVGGSIPAINPTINTLGSGFADPSAVAVDGAGDVFVVDYGYSLVKEIVAVGGSIPAINPNILTLGGGFHYPDGVAVDGAGNVYVADTANSAMKEIPLSTPPDLSFASTAIGSTSSDSPKSLLLQNVGNAALTFPKPGTGTNPSISTNFTLGGGSTCPQLTMDSVSAGSLAPGVCTDLISFTPTVSGDISGQMVIGDDNLLASGAMQTIALSGTAVYPEPAVAGISPTIGAAAGGTTVTITGTGFTGVTSVNFGGTAAPSFIVNSDTSITAIAPAGSGAVSVIVTGPGGTSAIQFVYQQAQTILFTPPATGVAGASATLTAIGGASGNPVIFSVISGPATASGANGSTLTFTGSGTVVVEADQAGAPDYAAAVPVQGSIAISPAPATYTAPTTAIGSISEAQTAYVNITTAGTLGSISVVTQGATGLDFNVVPGGTCATATAYTVGEVCTVEYSFTATHPGVRLGGITLSDSSGNLLGNSYITGTGTGPQIAYSPAAMSTPASGFSVPYDVAVDGSGNLYELDYGTGVINKVSLSGGVYGAPITIATGFNSPVALAIDGSGNIFVADYGNNLIKEVVAVNGSIPASPTILTLGSGFNSPCGIAVDSYGDVFVGDRGSNSVKEILAVNGVIPSVNPTINVLSSGFNRPWGVAVDANGDVFVANNGNSLVQEIVAVDGSIPASNPQILTLGSGFNGPNGVAVDWMDNVYVADQSNNQVKEMVAVDGAVPSSPTILVLASGVNATGVKVDGGGNVFAADLGENKLVKLDVSDPPTLSFASTLRGSTSSDSPQTVTISNIGNAALTLASANFPTDFPNAGSGSGDCAATNSLGADAACSFTINFTPTSAAGPLNESLVLTDNNLNATTTPATQQAIVLSGTSIAPVPVLTGISPAIGLATGGAMVTITGTGFTAATSVNFGGTPAASFTIISDTSVTAIAPAGSGTVDLAITTSGGTSATSPSDLFSYQQLQTILFTPQTTGVAGTSVTLTATGGASGNPVTFSVISGQATVNGSNGSTLMFTGSGAVVVEADQAGAPGFAAAAPVQGSIAVAAAPASYIAPTTAVGSPTAAQTVYVNFTTGGILGSISVVTQGATGLDFTDAVTGDTCSVGTAYSAGAVCAVNVIFAPKYEGPRYGAVVLKDGSGNLLASSYVNGVGTGPQITFANTTQGNLAPNSVSTLGGSFSFSNPLGMTIDASGNVFIADTGNHAVEEIPYTAGVYGAPVTLASSFSFKSPYGVAVDGAGNVFVSDNGGNGVYEILAAGGYTTVNPVGNGTSNSDPKGIAVDGAANIYVAGPDNNVYEILAAGGYTTVNELGGGFLNPGGIAVDATGDIFVADSNNLAIKEMPAGCASSTCVMRLAGISYPVALAIDGAGDLYIANDGLTEFPAGGSYATSFRLSSSISNATSIVVAPNGNVFFTNGNSVQEFDYADAPSLTYATSTPLGERDKTDGRQTVTVTNIGNGPLTFGSVSYAGDFPEASANSGACSTSTPLAMGTGCTLPVTFTPTSTTGVRNESLVLTDNNLNATTTPGTEQTIALSGTALAGVAATQAVASVVLTENQAATSFTPVTGSGGTAPLTYSVSPGLPAGLTLNTSTGAITGAASVTSAAASYTVTVTDANGGTATASFSLTVDSAVVATQEVASTALTESHTAVAFTPVAGSGGDAPLAYSVLPGLPTGLTLNASTGAVTGTPTVTSAATSYTVTVTDANGATATASFSLTVDSAVVATQEVASTALTESHTAVAFTPVAGSGGDAPLAYSVSPGLPTGLTLNANTGAITGTASVTSAATSYTVTVTDANGATATASFSLTINAAVAATQVIASTALTVNHLATSFTPVEGSGGTGTLAYSVSPELPAGLVFNANTGAITGTPSVTSAATTYTVTATDTNGATATASFSLTVNVAVAATQAVATTVLTQNHAATSFTPVTGSGGTAPLAYSVLPGLPTGLTLNASTGAVTGTPTVTSAAASYTVTVTDANGATATASFSLSVNAAVVATQEVAATVLTQNHAAAAFTPVTGSGGTAPLTYSVSPGLPAGLTLNATTGAVSGTPSGTSVASIYLVTVTDANGATAQASFSLTINAAVAATQAIASTVVTESHAATSFTPVTGSGGTAPLTYSVSPGLPEGLMLNASTGAITGTPTVTSVAASYTVTVTDANGATAQASFSLTVDSAVVATQAVASTALTQNQAVVPFTPVAGSGGDAPLAYSVSPGLPSGLVLNTSTGAITGTPTGTSAATSYTVTVTDVNGATATASFSLTVNSAVVATQSVATESLTFYQTITPFTPVTGSGGTTPLTYSVSPGLPAGLVLNASTGVISGTPTAVSAAASYTVTVTDANGETAQASFMLGVAQQASVTVVSASPSTATPVQSVTLSATVAPTVAGTPVTPTGTVTFFDGATQLGAAVPLSGGTAQLVVPSLPPGQTAVITAVYSGDGNFLGGTSSNSASVVVGPLDFTFTNTGTAAYTAAPGAVASYLFALAPLYGSYAGPVSFTVTGLPAGAVASFTPSSVAADGGAVPVTMTVQTASAMARNKNDSNSPLGRGIVLALLLLPFGMKRKLREKLRGRMLLLVLLLAGMTAAVTGCGSNNGFMLQRPGSYTLTVTATSGTLQHSQTVTLIVQ